MHAIPTRIMIFAGLLAFIAVLVSGWSYSGMSDSRAAAIAAADDLVACHRLVGQIRRLRDQPTVADSYEPQQHELTRRIEGAAQQAQISIGSLDRIWPEPAMYVADTPYKKHATQVVLRGITLQQIVTLIHTLESQEGGPRLTRVRLASPRDDATGNLWNVEATLTYLIYTPRVRTTSLR